MSLFLKDANFFSKCVFGTDNVADLATSIQNQMTAQATASGGFDLSTAISAIIIAVIVVAAIIALVIGIRLVSQYVPDKKWTDQYKMYQGKWSFYMKLQFSRVSGCHKTDCGTYTTGNKNRGSKINTIFIQSFSSSFFSCLHRLKSQKRLRN
jgi:hypothetical protein